MAAHARRRAPRARRLAARYVPERAARGPGARPRHPRRRAPAIRARRTSPGCCGWRAGALVLLLDFAKGAIAAGVGCAVGGRPGACVARRRGGRRPHVPALPQGRQGRRRRGRRARRALPARSSSASRSCGSSSPGCCTRRRSRRCSATMLFPVAVLRHRLRPMGGRVVVGARGAGHHPPLGEHPPAVAARGERSRARPS